MKAIVINEFGGPEVLQYKTIDKQSPNHNEVLIKSVATSVNFADILARQGKYHVAGKPPIIPGLDVTGIIEAVGKDVTQLKVGQHVIAFPKTGSYAEYVVADEQLTFVIPDDLDFSTAAAAPLVSFTSYKLLFDVAKLQKGETVLIHAAAGGIGTTAIKLAKIIGAKRIIGTVGIENKIPVALEAGADDVICYEKEDFATRVNELTDGQGVDVILDSIAGKVGEKSLHCLATFGRLVVFGNASGNFAQYQSTELHASCRSVLGFSFGTAKNLRPEILRGTAEQVINLLSEGLLDIKIGKRFTLEEAVEAHRLIESRQSVGKIILET